MIANLHRQSGLCQAGLTVIGTPFSTFTRTITLALREKGVDFEQVCILTTQSAPAHARPS